MNNPWEEIKLDDYEDILKQAKGGETNGDD